jgi:hypothetical protein
LPRVWITACIPRLHAPQASGYYVRLALIIFRFFARLAGPNGRRFRLTGEEATREMMIDLFASLVVAAAAAFGWRRGAANMALWAAGLVGGYIAALLLFRPVGSLLASSSGLPELLTYPVAGMAVLFLTSSLVNWQARRVRKRRAAKIEDGWEPPGWERLVGLTLGGSYGVTVVIILAWAASSLGGLFGGGAPAVRSSLVGRVAVPAAQQAFRVAAQTLLGDPLVSNAVARALADPLAATQAIDDALSDSRLHELAESESVREAIMSGDANSLTRNPTIAALAADEALLPTLRDFGLLERGSGPVSAEALSEAITSRARPAIRAVEAIRNDEEIQDILDGEWARSALESGDYVALLVSDEFSRLSDRVLEEFRRD